jgi:hypothetical protein
MCCWAPPRGGGACPRRGCARAAALRGGLVSCLQGQDVLMGAAAGRRRMPPQRPREGGGAWGSWDLFRRSVDLSCWGA